VKKLRSLVFLASGLGAGLVFAAVAVAGLGTSLAAYGGEGGNAQANVEAGAVGSPASLPFTGLNLALIAVAGVALIATGLVLRRRSRSTS